MLKKTLLINGVEKHIVADPKVTLADLLRKQLFLTGTKVGHGKGGCGASTVIMNGKAVKACEVLMGDAENDDEIITIEGIGTDKCLHPLQLSWVMHEATKCGFTTPGFIVSAKALLDENPSPKAEEVEDWFEQHDNVCEDEGIDNSVEAVLDAVKLLSGELTAAELWAKTQGGITAYSPELLCSEAVAKATGAWKFDSDLGLGVPEGTLYARPVYAKEANANILSVDTAEAAKLPGVFKVVTAKDVTGTNRIAGGKPIICERKIANICDVVAVVIAFKPGIAAQAASLVVQKLEKLGDGGCCECEPAIEPVVGFAYLSDKGKLTIRTSNANVDIAALADGIGVPAAQIAFVETTACSADICGENPSLEALLGVAVCSTKKSVYLEL